MGKGKDGSECYTRFNKGGGKYVVCEGVQEARKKKREANKSKPPPKKPSPKQSTPSVKKATPPPPKKASAKQTKTFDVNNDNDYDEMVKILAKDSKTDRWGFGKHISKYMKSKTKLRDINDLKEYINEKYKNNKYVYNNVIFANDDYRPSYVYRGKIYDKLSNIS
jgi:hypothetical protein